MHYTEFSPHSQLLPYIDCYWQAVGEESTGQTERILPDGCVDIILNLGENFYTDNMVMTNENVYLVGTMTRCKQPSIHCGIKLFGIRFKPAAFAAFFNYTSLRAVTDNTIDFDKKLSPLPGKIIREGIGYLNKFFLEKFAVPRHSLFPVIAEMQQYHGTLPVEMIAKRHFITGRQLERKFNEYLGVSPREFSSFVRYRFAVDEIKKNISQKSLQQIARECGYYDHAHLTHQVKKYTGLLPSELRPGGSPEG